MELFYYCLSAPKEDTSPRHTRLYVADPINYDEKAYDEAGIVDSDSEVEQFGEKEPLTYSDLNQSLDEVQAPGLELPETGMSPVDEEDLAISPEEVPHEHAANLLRRHNSRKFKTPSFKWKKKSKPKRGEPLPYYVPTPSAPEMTMSDSPEPVDEADLTQDDNLEGADDDSIVERKISVDSLNDKLVEKESEAAASVAASDGERERLVKDALFYQERLRDAEELLNRYKTDNAMLHQRVEMAERDRGALQHGNYVELEKVREEYQEKLNELSLYPEQLSSAEARREHAEAQTDALQAQPQRRHSALCMPQKCSCKAIDHSTPLHSTPLQNIHFHTLADKNETVAELNQKIDLFQGQIAKLKDKFHSVNEDNIELSNKAHSHEKKQMAADMHNKNLMDLVSKKDQTVESQQPSTEMDGKLLPPHPASPSTDNNMSDDAKEKEDDSETETESTDESEEEVDWSEMLKSAEVNRERLGLDDISDGESSVDEEGNRYIKKKDTNGITSVDIMNRMATNQFLGYDEFGRPINGKYNGSMMSGRKGHKNRALLFGMDGGKRNKSKGSNNKGSRSTDRSGRSGRRAKKSGNMALLGF